MWWWKRDIWPPFRGGGGVDGGFFDGRVFGAGGGGEKEMFDLLFVVVVVLMVVVVTALMVLSMKIIKTICPGSSQLDTQDFRLIQQIWHIHIFNWFFRSKSSLFFYLFYTFPNLKKKTNIDTSLFIFLNKE